MVDIVAVVVAVVVVGGVVGAVVTAAVIVLPGIFMVKTIVIVAVLVLAVDTVCTSSSRT